MKKLLAVLLAVCLMLTLAACGSDSGNQGGSGDDAEAAKGGNFVVYIAGDPTSYNPDFVSDDSLWPIAQNMYNRLVKLTAEDTVIPDLAESYEYSEDGMKLTFHLQEGVKWHDGEAFTSEDVKWTYDTIKEQAWFQAGSLASIDTIECPDENTVVFNLTSADATIIYKLGWYGTFILPKHLFEGQDPTTCEAAVSAPVGTGPFKFESSEAGVGVTLVRNDDFFGDKANPDKLTFAIYTDQEAAYEAFMNGEVDYLGFTPVGHTDEYNESEEFRVFTQLDQNRTYITFNFEDEDFGKAEVRKAVQLALDIPGIFERVGGTGASAEYYISPLQAQFVNEEYKNPERNVEEAVKLLEEAGYTKDADGFYLHAQFDLFEDGNLAEMAQIIKANLAEAGIDLTINMTEQGAWAQKVMMDGDFAITMLAGYQGPDISGLALRIQTGGAGNVAKYSNARVDELLEASNCETDIEKRIEQFGEIQKIMSEELPIIPILENGSKIPVRTELSGTPFDMTDKAASREFTYLAKTEK